MKVAHICPRINFKGGTEKFVREVNASMNMLGIKSAIYSSDLIPGPAHLASIVASKLLGRRAIRGGFDRLIFHKGQGASVFFRKVRSTCYFHQVKYDDLAGGTIVRKIYRSLIAAIERDVSQAVCNSKYVASRLRRLLPRARVSIVYPGVQAPPLEPDEFPDEEFCYYHSRLSPRKNQDFLLNVFETSPYNLVLTGGTWDRQFWKYHKVLIERAARMSNVRLLTDVSDQMHFRLLNQSSLFLFPAEMEPFGIVLLDAMSQGKPIIALNSGASPEVLGDAGILCDSHLKQWRTAIVDVLTNGELRSSLSRKSRARVSGFTWERTARELIGVLENT